jgi:hypothetical protein
MEKGGMSLFLLTIQTISGRTLTYKVKDYTIENNQVIFVDYKTNLEKRFSIDRVDIEEVRE